MDLNEKLDLYLKESFISDIDRLVQHYINKIKNKEKKAYAQAYFDAKVKGEELSDSSYDRFKCGAMAKQAVRMAIDELMGG